MPRAGTSTHGPGTRMHAGIPRHSFVAAAGRRERRRDRERGDEARASDGSHTSLRNQSPERTAPASMNASPPPAADRA